MPTWWYILVGFVVVGTIIYLALTKGHPSLSQMNRYRKALSEGNKPKPKPKDKQSAGAKRARDWEGYCQNQIEEKEEEGFYDD